MKNLKARDMRCMVTRINPFNTFWLRPTIATVLLLLCGGLCARFIIKPIGGVTNTHRRPETDDMLKAIFGESEINSINARIEEIFVSGTVWLDADVYFLLRFKTSEMDYIVRAIVENGFEPPNGDQSEQDFLSHLQPNISFPNWTLCPKRISGLYCKQVLTGSPDEYFVLAVDEQDNSVYGYYGSW